MIRFLCTLAVIASFALAALADIPPPPPGPGIKRVPLEHLVKLDKEIPGYKFYAYRGSIGGGDAIESELKLGTEKGIKVAASSSPSLRTGVIAVPVKLVDELKTNEKLAELASWKNKDKLPAGVVIYSTRGTSQDLKSNDPRSKVENVITISADEKAGVKFTAAETPAPPSKDSSSESSTQPPGGMLIGGIAMSLAFVTSGLWWFRRK
jgi:hypothetical protein